MHFKLKLYNRTILLLLAYLFLSVGETFGQNSTPDVKQWMNKARKNLNEKPDSCLYYTDLIKEKAARKKDYWALSKSFTYSGRVKGKSGQIEAAIIDYFEALRWINKADTTDDFNTGVVTRNIADILTNFKNHEEAQVYYDSALFFLNRHVKEHPKVAKQDNDYRHIQGTLYARVEGLRRLGKVKMAQDILLGLLKDQNTSRGTRINSHYQLGFIFNDLSETDSARSFFNRGLNDTEATPFYVGRGLHNLAMVSFQQKEYKDAIRLYKKAVAVKEELSNKKSLYISLMDLGESYLLDSQLDSAFHYLSQSLSILDKREVDTDPDYFNVYLLLAKASGSDMKKNWSYLDQYTLCNNEFLRTQQSIKDEVQLRSLNLSIANYRAEIEHKEEIHLLDRKYIIGVLILLILATVASVLGAKSLNLYWRKKRSKDVDQVLRPRSIREH